MTLKVVISLVLLSLTAAVSAQQDWCDSQSCREYDKGMHTLCAYQSDEPGESCLAKGDLGGGFSDEDKDKIVNLHNELRQKVASGNETKGSNGPQPSAESGSMPNLQWDDTLAMIAQRWADQCHYEHDKCRDVPDYQVGQNIHIGVASTAEELSKLDVLKLVREWYDEVANFDRTEVSSFSGNLKAAPGTVELDKNDWVGHYTQMVWAGTTKIGCGLRNYYDEDTYYKKFLVCNYGPAGNFVGQAIY